MPLQSRSNNDGDRDQSEYVKVVPSMVTLDTDDVIGFIKSLRKVDRSTFLQQINPLVGPATFEFLIHSEGKDAPVEFLFGCSDARHLDILERKLRSAYPDSFDISRITFSIANLLRSPNLQKEPDGGKVTSGSAIETVDPNTLEAYGPAGKAQESELPGPSEEVLPLSVVRWDGVGEKSKDYMTTLARYSTSNGEHRHPSRSSLSYILEIFSDAEFPIVFQVLFQRRPNWSGAASRRKNNIRLGQDGAVDFTIQWIHDLIFGISTEEKRDRYRGQTPTEPGEGSGAPVDTTDDIAGRAQLINAKIPARTYTVNVRAAAIPADAEQVENVKESMALLCTAFDQLDGYFYSVKGSVVSNLVRDSINRLTNGRIRSAGQREFERMTRRSLVSSMVGKRRPHLVLNHDELANFVTVPSAKTLTVAGARGTEGKLPSQNPLPRPPVGELEPFREPGMEIGHAMDENHDPETELVNVPVRLQTKHTLVAVPTGGGKSIHHINAAESIARNNGGPVVMIDPKGDGMCLDYLRVHYASFGNLNNVYHFRIPEVLPAIPFFDIRPRIASPGDRDPKNVREEAIQDKVAYTHEILQMVIGRGVYDRAFANSITSYLIHALFDEEYGSDAFGLYDLWEAALEMQGERTIPPVTPGRPNDPERSLTRHFSKDKHQFQQSMDAVLNRLDEIKKDSFLSQIFSHVPEWDDAKGEFVGNVFDFRRFLDEDVVILFDMGDLRPEAQRILTMVILSHIWDAVQDRRRGSAPDYEKVTNVIIDEAAPIAATEIVSEQLLPQSRSFGLGITLLVQYPRQIRNVTGNDKAYEEVLNNVHHKIIGDISIDERLLNSLVHDELSPDELRNRINRLPNGEWVVQLPSPGFGESKPPLFSLKPLDIPSGHPESEDPLSSTEERRFVNELLPAVNQRTRRECGIRSRDGEELGSWGSFEAGEDDRKSGEDDIFSSMFIGSSSRKEPADSVDHRSPHGDSDSGTSGDGAVEEERESTDPVHDEDLSYYANPQSNESSRKDGRESVSDPIPPAGAGVSDDIREKFDLTNDDVRFLKRVLDAMNDDLPEYSILDSMTSLTEGLDNLDINRLIDHEFIEEDSVSRRRYYTVLPEGRRLLGETMSVGPGTGDLGEKTPHKVGIQMLASWFEAQEFVSRVETYHEYDSETVFDVAAFDDSETLVWVGEVELESKDKRDAIRDFDKISSVGVESVWLFKNHAEAISILDTLADSERLEPVTGRERKTIAGIREAVESQEIEGLSTLHSFRDIESELGR